MTEQPQTEPQPRAVQPAPRSRLADLHAAYGDAKARLAAAEAEMKTLTDAIKVELTAVDPNERRFELVPAEGVAALPLRLTYTETWRFDSTRFKKENPLVYVTYAKKSGSWRLAPAKGPGESDG